VAENVRGALFALALALLKYLGADALSKDAVSTFESHPIFEAWSDEEWTIEGIGHAR
jgi:hypothetical protein